MRELEILLTPEALRLVERIGPLSSSDDVLRAVSRLRAEGHPAELVAAATTQARLRTKARAKFGEFAEGMLFTPAGLEQATRMPVAALHAGRMRQAGVARLADLGCGIGGDALAFAGAGIHVDAVEADPVTAGIAAFNLAPFGADATVRVGRAEETDLGDAQAVWLDPARRTAGHRETRRVFRADYSPSLDWAYDLATRIPAGIKLGPGHDRDDIPDDVEAQWVSVDGDTVELVLWSGALRRGEVRRSALVIRRGKAHEMVARADAPDAETRPLGEYLHEPDGAVIRARLIGKLARELDAGMLDARIAYLTSDAPAGSPFVSSFRVRGTLPLDVKTLAKALRDLEIGRLEIKKRGVDLDPAALRAKLKLKGSESATLIVTRVGEQRLGILADRV